MIRSDSTGDYRRSISVVARHQAAPIGALSQHFRITIVFAAVLGFACVAAAQGPETIQQTKTPADTDIDESKLNVSDENAAAPSDDLLLKDFRPTQKLKVKQTLLRHASMTVIDVHTHFFYKLRHNEQALDDFVKVMDRNQIAVCVSLDGRLGDQLERHQAFLWKRYRDRFAIFANIDWMGDGEADQPSTWACHSPGFAMRTANDLRIAVQSGVCGVKLFKRFGLSYRNPDGSLIAIDDGRWDPIWQACGQLGIPIIIHTADPAAFFDPIDENNERYEELSRHPDWSFCGEQFPTRSELLAARNRVIERHPNTNFIGAHVANNAEDLSEVAQWLDRYPNLFIEPASRISELGRQPFTARKFIIKYADRILFGTDGPWPEKRLSSYWRFFETDDESFQYSEKTFPPQGLWRIYGIDLPTEVLRKIYHENAAKLIPGVRNKLKRFEIQNGNAETSKESSSE